MFRRLLPLIPCSLLSLVILPIASAQNQISLGPSSGAQNETVQIPLSLAGDTALGGMQIELTYDPTAGSFGTPQRLIESSTYRAAGEVIAPGNYRLLVMATGQGALPTGKLVNIPFTLSEAVSPDTAVVSMQEVILADTFGLERAFSMAPYIEFLAPSENQILAPGAPVILDSLADFGGDLEQVELFADGVFVGRLTPGSGSLTWTPQEPGPTVLQPFGRIADGTILRADQLTVTVPGEPLRDYETWKNFYFTSEQSADDSVSGPSADPDEDQRSNLVEYSEGTSPLVADETLADTKPFFMETNGQSHLALRIRRRVLVDDVEHTVAASTDLRNETTAEIVDQEPGGNFEIVTFQTPDSISESPRGFLSIKVVPVSEGP